MKQYEQPTVELSVFSVEDVITTSTANGTGNDGNLGGLLFD